MLIRFQNLLILFLLGCTACTLAQQQSQVPANTPPTSPENAAAAAQAPASTQTPKTPEETERQIERREQSQRILGVVPMFSVTNRHNAPPLTTKGKFRLMTKSLFDPFVFGIVGVQAGISQANDNFAEYGQGAEGYAKRYGAAYADSASSNFFSNFFYPVLFKQDPRYFRWGEGTIKYRIGHAIAEEFVAHQDSGRRNFHFSNVLGAITAGTISNAYYPQEDRGVGLTASRAGLALFYGALGNIGIEFWPDIDRKFFHKKQADAGPPPAAPEQPTQDTPK
jgi:hypothetical protein